MTAIKSRSSAGGTRTFLLIWFGQLISLVGSNMTSFGLGVWISQNTGSVTQYAITILCNLIPTSLTAPIAGAIVDRFDRRKVMIISDTCAGLSSLFVAVMFFSGRLEAVHIYGSTIVTAIAGTFQAPAFQATITLLVPKERYKQAAGLLQLAEALGLLIAPPLAGLLLVTIRLQGIILLDFATLFFSLFTMLTVKFPSLPLNGDGLDENGNRRSILGEIIFGLRFILRSPGFVAMTLYVVAFLQILFGFATALITPLVLSFADEFVFGLVIGAIGIGALVGGVLMALWGGFKSRTTTILVFAVPYGLSLIAGGLRPDPVIGAIAGFTLGVAHSMVIGSNRVLWQIKVPAEIQGRVFSTRLLIAVASQSLGTLLAGPLADRVFTPFLESPKTLTGLLGFDPLLALSQPGWLSTTIGQLIGVGPGRGIALMFVILGCLALIATIVAARSPAIRRLERDVPDAITIERYRPDELPAG